MAKLYFKYGAMNSGKSTILLQTAHNYNEQGMNVLILKPAVDTRKKLAIYSRLGISKKVDYIIDAHSNIYEDIKEIISKKDIECLLVDEVQFLKSSQIDELYKIAVMLDVPVICYGLRTDFLNKGFEGSSRLLELAHSIAEMKNICECGNKATCNIRLVNNVPVFHGNKISIDNNTDNISYKAVCSKCFILAQEDSQKEITQ